MHGSKDEWGDYMELDVIEGFIASSIILLAAYLTASWISPPIGSAPPVIMAESLAYSIKRQAAIHALTDLGVNFKPLLENFTRESGLSLSLIHI